MHLVLSDYICCLVTFIFGFSINGFALLFRLLVRFGFGILKQKHGKLFGRIESAAIQMRDLELSVSDDFLQANLSEVASNYPPCDFARDSP